MQSLVTLCQDLGWLVNMDPKQVFDFVGYQFDLKEGKVRPTLDRWQTLTTKIKVLLTGPVPHRGVDSNRKTGSLCPTPFEAYTVAPPTKLKGPGIPRKGDTSSQIAPPAFKTVPGGKQCATRSTITPTKTCSAIVYRHIKRWLGRLLK